MKSDGGDEHVFGRGGVGGDDEEIGRAEAEGAENGALVLQARYKPGFVTFDKKKFDFVSGRIDTRGKFEFANGTASARMKLPAGSGFWPAFWALGNGKWPDTGEIDIMENVGEMDWTSVALHGPKYSGGFRIAIRCLKIDQTGRDIIYLDPLRRT